MESFKDALRRHGYSFDQVKNIGGVERRELVDSMMGANLSVLTRSIILSGWDDAAAASGPLNHTSSPATSTHHHTTNNTTGSPFPPPGPKGNFFSGTALGGSFSNSFTRDEVDPDDLPMSQQKPKRPSPSKTKKQTKWSRYESNVGVQVIMRVNAMPTLLYTGIN
ncbi:hypothetical protein PROFUN_09540 [Planoprotostelium fungivorum]|uniref:Uncharacterized protein n=1 Tax=Planoprotostelium fungivorum TaxID=1890364 RepID=A0A2P6MT18_9EUKA|nr:hypothetical protein PROFUN_09540 [Planoprotostelium fungivorum]